MVRFEFTLSDDRAECLLNAVQAYVAQLYLDLLDPQLDDATKAWIKRHIDYVKEIQETVAKGRSRA